MPGRADLLDDPAGPRQRHHAPPLPRALPADPDRARHRPRGAPGRPPGGAAARAPGPARDHAGAADPRRPEPRHRELHHATPTRSSASSSRTSRTSSRWVERGRRRRRDLGHAAATSCAPSFRRFPSSSTSCGRRWRASASSPTSRRRSWWTSSAPRPTSTRFFTRLGPFAEASPARRRARSARPARSARRRSREGKQEIAELRALPRTRPRFAKPLRQFLQTIDDRKRAIENDPRAKATRAARAGPDRHPGPRAASRAWRRSGTTSTGRRSASTCSTTRPHPARVAHGRAGLLELAQRAAEDAARTRRSSSAATRTSARTSRASTAPTRSTTARTRAAARCARTSGKPRVERLGEQRGEGQPEARPVPGQPDLSKPQIMLPPGVQDLLDWPDARASARQLDRDDLTARRAAPTSSADRSAAPPADDQTHRPAPRLPARAMSRRPGTAIDRRQPGPGRGGHACSWRSSPSSSPTTRTPACRSSRPTTSRPSCRRGAKLVKGNEVRVGGFRVGLVEDIKPKVATVNGERRSVAVAELKLDKNVEPLAADTTLRVRPRSALGLQVRRAHARHEQGRRSRPATRSRSKQPPSRSSSRTSSRRSTARPAPTSARPRRASATPSPAAACRSTSAIAGAQPVLHAPDAGDAEPRPTRDTELDQFFRPARRARPRRWRRSRDAGASCSRTWPTRSRRSPRDPRALQADDREGAADARRLDRLVPGAAPVPRRLRRPLGAAAARRRRSCRARCPRSTARFGSARRSCRGPSS